MSKKKFYVIVCIVLGITAMAMAKLYFIAEDYEKSLGSNCEVCQTEEIKHY